MYARGSSYLANFPAPPRDGRAGELGRKISGGGAPERPKTRRAPRDSRVVLKNTVKRSGAVGIFGDARPSQVPCFMVQYSHIINRV